MAETPTCDFVLLKNAEEWLMEPCGSVDGVQPYGDKNRFVCQKHRDLFEQQRGKIFSLPEMAGERIMATIKFGKFQMAVTEIRRLKAQAISEYGLPGNATPLVELHTKEPEEAVFYFENIEQLESFSKCKVKVVLLTEDQELLKTRGG